MWRFKIYSKGGNYSSPYIYKTKEEALKAGKEKAKGYSSPTVRTFEKK